MHRSSNFPWYNRSIVVGLLIILASVVICGDGEPESAAMIDHEAVTLRYVQARKRSTVGIVAGGVDGIARTVHLGREDHIAQVAATDRYAGDRSRGGDTAA